MKNSEWNSSPSHLKSFDLTGDVIANILYLYVDNMVNFSQRQLIKLLEEASIERVEGMAWSPIQSLLSFYDSVLDQFGQNTIFAIGKTGPELLSHTFQDQSLVDVLANFNELYQQNHQGGYVGFYKMVEHDEQKQQITMQVYSPYPMMLTKGVLTGFCRQFSSRARVEVLDDHPQKSSSEHDLWFLITYRN